jgi:hypothetical protein
MLCIHIYQPLIADKSSQRWLSLDYHAPEMEKIANMNWQWCVYMYINQCMVLALYFTLVLV